MVPELHYSGTGGFFGLESRERDRRRRKDLMSDGLGNPCTQSFTFSLKAAMSIMRIRLEVPSECDIAADVRPL
jgi:hypothetical protein